MLFATRSTYTKVSYFHPFLEPHYSIISNILEPSDSLNNLLRAMPFIFSLTHHETQILKVRHFSKGMLFGTKLWTQGLDSCVEERLLKRLLEHPCKKRQPWALSLEIYQISLCTLSFCVTWSGHPSAGTLAESTWNALCPSVHSECLRAARPQFYCPSGQRHVHCFCTWTINASPQI